MGGPKFANTFEGPNTQNATFLNVTLSSVAVGFIPSYELDTMWMTESIGSGIIMSIVTAQLAQQYLSKTIGRPCSWATTCAINSFVYTIVVVMMGTSSAIFNPAVFFGWAIIGRTSFKNWILMFLAQVAGGLIGCLCAWSQVLVQLNRVPVPLKDRDGKFLYVMVPFKWAYWGGFREDPTKDWLAEAKTRPAWARAPCAWFAAKHWASPTFSADDVPIHKDEQWPHDTHGRTTNDGSDVAAAYVETAKGHEVISTSKYTEVPIDDPEYQLELKLDQKNKLMVFAETPHVYTWGFYACWWPHFVAGTTLCHWLSFMTGNASQLTNTNMYLTQPHGHAGENTPGNNYAFLNAVLLAWLVGLAYFLLTASAGVVCTLQLNPAADLAGRILHNLLPIPNKGYSGWNYSPVPLILPFFAAVCGCALMYMSMWSKLYFPFRPYGSMPHWW